MKVVKPIDAELAKSLASARFLTKYAVGYRYPDASKLEEVTRRKVTEAITVADSVFNILSKSLD